MSKKDITLEDLRPITDHKLQKRIINNIEYAKTALFINIHLEKNPSSFTTRDLQELLEISNSYAFQILDHFRIKGTIKKIHTQGKTVFMPLSTIKQFREIACRKVDQG